VQIGGHIPDLNHNWHAISILTCRTHVNGWRRHLALR
jgi:hypothetical protein